MESQELKHLVSIIFNDPETRIEFLKNPEVVISRFSLTSQEKKLVLNTHARLNLVLSSSQQLEEDIDPTVLWT
jgi:hypothetical protein